MIWYILLAIVAAFALIAVLASAKPDQYTIQRQGALPATAAEIFPYLNDVHQFMEWSPWAKLDPNMKLTYAGPRSGAGASFAWSGNGKIGVGQMTILESRPLDLVRGRFDFVKPMKCTATHEFALRPDGPQTLVTWTVTGPSPFFFKMISVFASPDKMMGKNLEEGLANLKAILAT